jgi:hypothetical protein
MTCTIRAFAVAFGVLFSLSGFAAAVLESVKGEVRAGAATSKATAARQGAQVQAGSTVVTGPKSLAVLRFDDRLAVVLNENSEFRIAEGSLAPNKSGPDKPSFELVKGGARFKSNVPAERGVIASRLGLPQATIGFRDADFMVALVNPAFISVLSGTIDVSTSAGTVKLASGSTATVATATSLAVSIAPSGPPAAVGASFSEMGSMTIAQAVPANSGALAAVDAAEAGGIAFRAVLMVGAGAALAALLVHHDNSSSVTGTTGTK